MQANKSSKYFLIGSSLLFLIVVFFVAKSIIKNKPPAPIPDTYDSNGGVVTNVSSFNPQPLTDSLFDDIHGINLYVRDSEAYQELAALTNTNLAKVMNDWDKRYYNKHDNMTLYEAIKDEEYNMVNYNLVESLKARMKVIEQTRKH